MPHSIIPMHKISPPLLNSACPWATTLQQLEELYSSEHTGAITTRTCTIHGYPDDPQIHRVAFFDSTNAPLSNSASAHSSINSYGYSPISLSRYLTGIAERFGDIWRELDSKPIIVSFSGSNPEVVDAWRHLSDLQRKHRLSLAIEVNLSCPNISGRPPPAFDSAALRSLLRALGQKFADEYTNLVPIGFKLPPYTSSSQFDMLRDELKLSAADGFVPSFLTATNTLGNCALFDGCSLESSSVLRSEDGRGLGGVGGATLHPLALGNVKSLRFMVDTEPLLKDIQLIGVGGVTDLSSFNRMRAAGADSVAVATALGLEGPAVFAKIYSSCQSVRSVD